MKTLAAIRNVAQWIVARSGLASERGATAVEYGIMVMLIASVIIVAVVFLGNETSETFSCTAESVSTKTDVC